MVVHSLQCTRCEQTRVGRDTDEGIAPVQRTCPHCGATDFVPLAARSND